MFLKELKLNDKPIKDCLLEYESNDKLYRLYSNINKHSFYTLAVKFNSCSAEFENHWDDPNVQVNQLFNTIAYFDGVRHLQFNYDSPNRVGYIYYPNMQELINLLQRVHEIELSICNI